MVNIEDIEKALGGETVSPKETIPEDSLREILKVSLIDPNKTYEKEIFILKMYEDNRRLLDVCSIGNISTTIGAAKSRKTFFSTMIMSALVSENSEFGMLGDLKGKKLLFIDTEQAPYHVQGLQRRIQTITNKTDNYDFLYLRHCRDMDTRLAFIDWYLDSHHKDYLFVIIDGIVDIVNDFNNQAECRNVVSQVMSWSAKYNIHINSVIHTNKDKGNARGHLGAELINKSEVAFRTTKIEDNITEITCEASRNKDFSKFDFIIENGLPVRQTYPIGYFDNEPKNKTLDVEPNKNFIDEDPF